MTSRKPGWRQLLVGSLLILTLATSLMPAQAASGRPYDPLVVRLYYQDRAELDAVAGSLDIWEVHHDAGYALVALTPAQFEWLAALGYRLEVDATGASLQGIQAPLDPRYYYFDVSYPNGNGLYLVNFLQNINATYPALTELIDIGDGWETGNGGHQRDIWALRITNEDPALGEVASKPAFFLLAGIHAREVTTPELAIRYIQYLTGGYGGEGGYGVDPDVTWLVDYHVTYVVVLLNPDGHRKNEEDAAAWWRKNVDDDDGCSQAGMWGVDLNRNHSFFWGAGGSSIQPCNETYRGPARASEPETEAFQGFFASVMEDQNGPNGDDELPQAAPDDTSGIFITLHSYSDLVLWPWGYSYAAAPNAGQLRTIGRKFAYFNGYVAQQSSELYPASGTTDDWTYGKFGVASFTFEVGQGYSTATTTCKGFVPAYECIDTPGPEGPNDTGNFWPENRPALVYAHKIARTPYLTAWGPDAVDLAISQPQSLQGAVVEVTVSIDDTRYSDSGDVGANQVISAAELYIDVPPWLTGSAPVALPMEAEDGAFDSTVEPVVAIVPTAGLSLGRHTLFVRGQDAAGNWGAFSAIFLTVASGNGPGALGLEVSPPSIPIVQGQASAVATLTLPGGEPAPGWMVTFTASAGTVMPPVTFTGADGRAITTLQAGGAPGVAQVTAEAMGPLTDALEVEFYVPEAPTAGFVTGEPACAGQALVFTNTSTSPVLAPAAYLWDFGDGATGTQASPQHVYRDAGLVTVTLEARNAGGGDTVTSTVAVQAPADADWSLLPLTPRPGERVQFIDRSQGALLAWHWDFGDGSQASLQSPEHTFATSGTYTVALQVQDECGWSEPEVRPIEVGGEGPRFLVYLPLFFRSEPN